MLFASAEAETVSVPYCERYCERSVFTDVRGEKYPVSQDRQMGGWVAGSARGSAHTGVTVTHALLQVQVQVLRASPS